MATQILETISQDEKEQMIYEAQLLYEADQAAEWSYRERQIREEVEKEKKEAIEKAERVEKEAIEKAESEKKEIAKNLKLMNFPLDAISKGTGIPIEVIEAL